MAGKSDYDKFLAEVLDTVPDDQKKGFEELMKSEKVASAVKERVMARSDYSRSKDDLDGKVKEFSDYVEGEKAKIAGWYGWYEGITKDWKSLQDANKAYEDTYGKLDGTTTSKKYATPEEVNKTIVDTMRERDAAAIKFADMLTDLKIDYRNEFGKRLDTQSLLDMAGKNGLPLDAAYERFTAEDRKVKQEADITARIEAAKKEAVKEALSQHKMPFQSGPVEPHVLDAPADVPRTSRDRVAAAIADWNTTDHSGPF